MPLRRAPRLRMLIAAGLALAGLTVPTAFAFDDTATDDSYTVLEDHQLSVGVIDGVFANDLTNRGPCVYATDVSGLQGHLPLDSLGPNGQFQFSPNVDFNGATSFTYTLGLVDGVGCSSTGLTATVTITVFELNDPPSILLDDACVNGVTVKEDSGAYAGTGHCVQMLDFGPQDEDNQSFDAWIVSTTHPELFSAKPKITQVDGLYGRLSFTPAPNANGSATVTVRGRDGGGTTDGGIDTSEPVKFKITITAVDDPTEAPTATETPSEPTPEATPIEAPSAEPPSSAAAPSEAATATLAPAANSPGATATPSETGADGGVAPLAIVLGIALVALLGGLGLALYLPRRRANLRG
jgi:hypothetical protein